MAKKWMPSAFPTVVHIRHYGAKSIDMRRHTKERDTRDAAAKLEPRTIR